MSKVRILLTGGGTGGHIYPLVAVAEELKKENVEIFYLGPKSDLNKEFLRQGIRVFTIAGGKWRRYFSLSNFADIFNFMLSCVQSLLRLFILMPDVVFSKGGTGSLPVVLASRFYFIPIIIHESDAVPGLASRISARCASRIAIAFRGAAVYFPVKKTAQVGNPVRPSLARDRLEPPAAKKLWGFDPMKAVVFVWGGSQGAGRLNEFMVKNLVSFLDYFQVIHQCGALNFQEVKFETDVILAEYKDRRARYRLLAYFDESAIKDALQAADLVISRAGAGSIFEMAFFGKPTILIPLSESAGDHQRANAYEYAEAGAAVVVEENNLGFHLVLEQARRILEDSDTWQAMSKAARDFAKPDAAKKIAEEIMKLAND